MAETLNRTNSPPSASHGRDGSYSIRNQQSAARADPVLHGVVEIVNLELPETREPTKQTDELDIAKARNQAASRPPPLPHPGAEVGVAHAGPLRRDAGQGGCGSSRRRRGD
jgi:hypothetical protein